ncbi:S49 family peptidase [Gammaproteobacteria bacterium]|nr:S49 family peptidase [Gammaproteobacteria bacterium]
MQNETDSQHLIGDLIKDILKEKRSDKRWKNLRFFAGLFFVIAVFALIFSGSTQTSLSDGDGDSYVSLIRLNGMIGPGQDFSAENVIPILKMAFKDKDSKGVILDINSGGGTPVQASIIHDSIIDLKKKYNKKVVVVGEDTLASGAYFVAVSADKIYVNPNSITGSIGVIMKGFGFPELIKKIGVERRVYTAGSEKDRLDPFLPQNPQDIVKIDKVIKEIHENFKNAVILGRKGKLANDTSGIFSGDFWSGRTALKLGIIDGLGNLNNVMIKEFKVARFKDYTSSRSVLKNIASSMGASIDNMLKESSDVKVLEKL